MSARILLMARRHAAVLLSLSCWANWSRYSVLMAVPFPLPGRCSLDAPCWINGFAFTLRQPAVLYCLYCSGTGICLHSQYAATDPLLNSESSIAPGSAARYL